MPEQIELVQGDITAMQVDAIVNAANKTLLGGGGVDGAIHRAGGKAILEQCRKIAGCETGEAVITTAGKLPAKYVIHTVGPVWNGGDRNEPGLLRICYENSLKLATKHELKTIAFPNISTGVYHFPKEKAAHIALDSVQDFLYRHSEISKVIFVCFDLENFALYSDLINC